MVVPGRQTERREEKKRNVDDVELALRYVGVKRWRTRALDGIE
jgi:hypothetical protein